MPAMQARRLPEMRPNKTIERRDYTGVTNQTNPKLRTMATRFDGFEESLTLAKQKRKDELEKHIVHLQKQIDEVRKSIALEAKNRAMSINAVQSWLSERIEKWTAEVQLPIMAQIEAVNLRIDKVNVRMDELEEEHRIDRETFPKLIDERCNELLVEIRDMKTMMELNIREREEVEQRIRVKVKNQHDSLVAMFQAEKTIQDKKHVEHNKELVAEVHTRVKGIEDVKRTVFDNHEAVKAEIEREVDARVRANEEVLAALAHFTTALQDGVKIVGL
jgi:hypothetical protein